MCLPKSRHGLISPARWLDPCIQEVLPFQPLLVQALHPASRGSNDSLQKTRCILLSSTGFYGKTNLRTAECLLHGFLCFPRTASRLHVSYPPPSFPNMEFCGRRNPEDAVIPGSEEAAECCVSAEEPGAGSIKILPSTVLSQSTDWWPPRPSSPFKPGNQKQPFPAEDKQP